MLLNVENTDAPTIMHSKRSGQQLIRLSMTLSALLGAVLLLTSKSSSHLRPARLSGRLLNDDTQSIDLDGSKYGNGSGIRPTQLHPVFEVDGDDVDDDQGSERRLGRRRRRRRRRKSQPEPEPDPAPDRSTLLFPDFIVLMHDGYCEDFGYEAILTTDDCLEAGVYLSGDKEQEFVADMPSGGWTDSGSDRPHGCAREGTGSLNPLSLHYFVNKNGVSGVNDFQTICKLPTSSWVSPYIIVRENRCENFGYAEINDVDECTAAGRYLARSSAIVASSDSTTGDSRPRGCAYHSSSGLDTFLGDSTLLWFKNSNQRWPAGACGVLNFDCICKHPSH